MKTYVHVVITTADSYAIISLFIGIVSVVGCRAFMVLNYDFSVEGGSRGDW